MAPNLYSADLASPTEPEILTQEEFDWRTHSWNTRRRHPGLRLCGGSLLSDRPDL